MKDYFTRLFGYDKQMNLLMTDLIIQAGSPAKPVQLMAHLLTAQQVWLARCNGESLVVNLWPDWPADTFTQIIADNYKGWAGFLESTADTDFENLIHYQNTKGDSFTNRMDDIITQVTNHGTHHRAQIGQHLAQVGLSLPYTDYIFYLRQL